MLFFRLLSRPPGLVTLLLALVLRAQLEAALVELPLRPRRAYLPYPSCPVPAAGPFFFNLSLGGGGFASFLGRRVKRPNREPNLDGLMLDDGLMPLGGTCAVGAESWDSLVVWRSKGVGGRP